MELPEQAKPELRENHQGKKVLERMRVLFQASQQSRSVMRSANEGNISFSFKGLEPLWDEAIQAIDSNGTMYTEVPIRAEEAILGSDPSFSGEVSSPSLPNHTTIRAKTPTVDDILQDLDVYYMSLMPSKEYLATHDSIRYKVGHVPTDFDGTAEYRDYATEQIRWIESYSKGKLIQTVYSEEEAKRKEGTKMVRISFCRPIYKKVKIGESAHTVGSVVGQQLPYLVVYPTLGFIHIGDECVDFYLPIEDVGGGGGGEGGGGGSNPHPGGNNPSPENDPNKPCKDLSIGKANPLMQMALAPTGSGNIKGATYGYTRNGGTKFHDGIDLAAEVGTPVFSLFDGKIVQIVSNQPNRIPTKKGDRIIYRYPSSYGGDTNDAGNRITIESTVNGKTIRTSFWHLNESGKGIAINSATGRPYKLGDHVKSGDQIGYTGRTGNAINVPNPHLHLNMKEKRADGNFARINPEKYLHATVNNQKIKIKTPCDK